MQVEPVSAPTTPDALPTRDDPLRIVLGAPGRLECRRMAQGNGQPLGDLLVLAQRQAGDNRWVVRSRAQVRQLDGDEEDVRKELRQMGMELIAGAGGEADRHE